MQKSREKAWKLLAWRTAPFTLACVGGLACYSLSPPASPPQENLLADPPPGAASADPATIVPSTLSSAPPEEEHKKMVFDEAQAKTMLARAATNAHTCVEVVRSEERRVGKECRSRWPPE